MRCDEHEPDLIDAAAGGPVSSRLAAHLEACFSCGQRLAHRQALLAGFEDALRGRLLALPSPELVDRAAVRLAGREAASRRTFQRALALAAALGVVVLAGVLARRPAAGIAPGPPAKVAVEAVQAPRSHIPERRMLAPVRPQSPRPTARALRGVSPPAVHGGSNPREPEVLVPAGQEEALGQFVDGLRRGALAAPPLLASATPPVTPLAPPDPIEIPPLVTNPLSDLADSPARSVS